MLSFIETVLGFGQKKSIIGQLMVISLPGNSAIGFFFQIIPQSQCF